MAGPRPSQKNMNQHRSWQLNSSSFFLIHWSWNWRGCCLRRSCLSLR